MKTLILFFMMITGAQIVFAGDTTSIVSSALADRYPFGGYSVSGGIAQFQSDFIDIPPTQAEIDAIVAEYTSLAKTQARQIAVITGQAQTLLSGYLLYLGQPRWTNYQTAVNAAVAVATTEINALTDVASVKNYKPVWPAKP